MNEFTTKAGTVLPLMNLKGKPYLQVAHRVLWMREQKPDWGIETEFLVMTDQYCIAKATIKNEQGRIIATAHKREDIKHFQDNNEKAESGAIGRALALCGYGTQFAEELDEADRIVDSPVQPAKKVVKTTTIAPVAPTAPTTQAPVATKPAPAVNTFQMVLKAANEYKWNIDEQVRPFMKLRYGKELSKELTQDQVAEFIKIIQSCTYDHAVEITMGMDGIKI